MTLMMRDARSPQTRYIEENFLREIKIFFEKNSRKRPHASLITRFLSERVPSYRMSEKFGEKVEKFLAFGGKLLVYEPIYAPEGVNTVFPDFLRAIIEKLGLFLQAIFGNFYLK